MQYASWMALEPVPFVPEILLHQGDDLHALWEATGLEAPPFWAFPWLGGQALARYVLDHPTTVAGRRVLDLATGSGIVALAARKAGAAHVLAVDVDPLAGEAVEANAAANGLDVVWWCADLLDEPVPDVDVVLVADALYDKDLAPRVVRWLDGFDGDVLVGDPLRDYFPRAGMVPVADYEIPTTRELEGVTRKRTRVFAPVRVTPRLQAFVRRSFADPQDVLDLLVGLPFQAYGRQDVERVHAALVLPAGGDVDEVRSRVALCTRDWRDALVAGGLGDVGWERVLDERLG